MNGQDDGIAEGNRRSWNLYAPTYAGMVHTGQALSRVLQSPETAFHAQVWARIRLMFPELRGKRVCVPSSGDNIAVFAFAMLGARVTSCDIAENQLENARKIALQYDWGRRIEFIRADTMRLDGVPDAAYDFVYTSNGVHVWINDLCAMYTNIRRVMQPGAVYMMYDIHPGTRPFRDDLTVFKPYDMTGPFCDGDETTFHWRTMDILNAMADAGLNVTHMEELFAEKNYEWPFWVSLKKKEEGVTVPREEVDRMYDWRTNPMMALPSWLSVTARAQRTDMLK